MNINTNTKIINDTTKITFFLNLCSFIQTPDSGSAASQSNKDHTNLGGGQAKQSADLGP